MSSLRKLLKYYRNIQYLIFRRYKDGVMSPGSINCVTPKVFEGDVVHPCVRYIEQGFNGHKWWMAYTPYYGSNAKIENPILCYGDSEDCNPPHEWHICFEIEAAHDSGYNSDPFIIFHGNKLHIFWRENDTPNIIKEGYHHATLHRSYDNNGHLSDKEIVIGEPSLYEDRETCPAIFFETGKWKAYGMHLRFKNEKIQTLSNAKVKNIINKIVTATSILGIYSQQSVKGISLWESDFPDMPFIYCGDIKFLNCNKLYKPWHMDIFEYKGEQYAVIQSNQCNADILLAKRTITGDLKIFKKPLLTANDIGMTGIYKACACVVDETFFLYYTAQNYNQRELNQLFVTKQLFSDVLSKVS